MTKVKLKVGDSVRTANSENRAVAYVKEISDQPGKYKYLLSDDCWYCREDIYKIPVQSPASKLAAANNFWQGRARSIQAQLDSLSNQLPYKATHTSIAIKELSSMLRMQAQHVAEIVNYELSRLKLSKEK